VCKAGAVAEVRTGARVSKCVQLVCELEKSANTRFKPEQVAGTWQLQFGKCHSAAVSVSKVSAAATAAAAAHLWCRRVPLGSAHEA
jgi:hypothetical protein